ncbi:MAG: DUF4920 domain-containing protein [Sphingobacteriales bacterium]|nr:DUF4920 domain-containing protein [Sphingobacteriales bacterium]
MKTIYSIFLGACLLLLLEACGGGAATGGDGKHFGKNISSEQAITMGDLSQQIQGTKQVNAKVRGKVAEVCQAKGCWMTIENTAGDPMRVTFKDYAFFVPKDLSGKSVVFEGIAKYDTTSVDDLRHYAEDEGKAAEEIAQITQPKVEVVFEAEGVVIE